MPKRIFQYPSSDELDSLVQFRLEEINFSICDSRIDENVNVMKYFTHKCARILNII